MNLGYNPDIHHRRSIRIRDYDYAQAGAYFITVCTQNQECVLGEIVDGIVRLNDAGLMIEKWWAELPNKFPTVQTDEYVVMPNHFHGIVFITTTDVGATLRGRPKPGQPHRVAPTKNHNPTVGNIVDWFKTMTTNEYIRGVKQHGWSPFPGKLWQRNYYEHIVRNDKELQRIRTYIASNPAQWADDENNPMRALPPRT